MWDLNAEHAYKPYDYGFDFAFGIGVPIDATIGYYTVDEISFEYIKNKD